MWKRKFLHTGKSPYGGDRRVLLNLRGGECSSKCMENQVERIHHGDQCRPALPSGTFVRPPQQVGARCWSSDFRGRPQAEDWGRLLGRYSGGASTTQLRETREKPGPVREPRDLCCRDPLTPFTHNLQNTTFTRARSRVGCGSGLRPQRQPSLLATNHHKNPRESKRRGTVTSIWNPKDEQTGWLLPRHTQVLEVGDKTLLQSLTSEVGMTGLKLWYLPVGLYCCRHSPHVPVVSAGPLTAPRPTEQVSPDKPMLSPLSCLGREQMPERGLPTETGPKPKLSSRGRVTQEQEGDLLAVMGSAD